MSEELYAIVGRLRVENEVNKILIHALKQNLLNQNKELIVEYLDSLNFLSEIIETQIKQSWSDEESILFRQYIDEELKRIETLTKKNNS
jgi:hypothetical protein